MKRIVAICLLIVCISMINAQLLWKITGNKLKESSYLFGTHHLISANFLDSIPNIYKSFNACNTVVGELNMNSIDSKTELYAAAMLPHGKNIKDYIQNENYTLVDTELKSVLKLGLKDMSLLQPNLIHILYSVEMYKKLFGYNSDFQVDSYFQAVGNEKGKKIVSLETFDKQISLLFDTTNIQRQADYLVETIRYKDSLKIEMNNIQKLYKIGDLEGLLKISQENKVEESFTDEEFAAMLDNRNKDWVMKLPEIIGNSSCFIAVGAMHLPGKNGIIKLLENAGYKVKPVK